MKDRLILILYLCLVVLATSIHRFVFLLPLTAVVYLFAYRQAMLVARRALTSILVFNSTITISYIIISLIQGDISYRYIALINLRVFLITSMTFLLHERLNPFKALAFSQTLLFLLTLSYSQILTYKKLIGEFHLALKSRTIRRLSLRDLYRHGATMCLFFLQKAMTHSSEVSQAMKSRGFFSD